MPAITGPAYARLRDKLAMNGRADDATWIDAEINRIEAMRANRIPRGVVDTLWGWLPIFAFAAAGVYVLWPLSVSVVVALVLAVTILAYVGEREQIRALRHQELLAKIALIDGRLNEIESVLKARAVDSSQ
jgi:hypothetical protein